MLGDSILCHGSSLGVLLTLSQQIRNAASAPVATTDISHSLKTYDDGDPTLTGFPGSEPTRTVLESIDGEVYVPYTTLTDSVSYTTNGRTDHSTIIATSYSTAYITITQTTTHASTTTPVLSIRETDTSLYTLPLSSELTS